MYTLTRRSVKRTDMTTMNNTHRMRVRAEYKFTVDEWASSGTNELNSVPSIIFSSERPGVKLKRTLHNYKFDIKEYCTHACSLSCSRLY